MIDIENDVFDYVYRALDGMLPENGMSAEYDPAPPVLPFVTLTEMDNYIDRDLRGTADKEEFAVVVYEMDVYAEDKRECRNIASVADEAMTRLGFTRLSLKPVINLADAHIHRMNGRYRAEANQDKTVFKK